MDVRGRQFSVGRWQSDLEVWRWELGVQDRELVGTNKLGIKNWEIIIILPIFQKMFLKTICYILKNIF